MRVAWAVMLAGVLVAGCAPEVQSPRPSGTLQPSITASSSEPERFKPSDACRLLTSEEREDLVRMSMDAEIPTRAIKGTEECVWTHSLTEPARSAIRVVAANGPAWARVAAPQIVQAINHPSTSKSLAKKLRQALADLSNSEDLTDARICEIYLEFTESRGMQRSEDMLFSGTIGSMPAVYAASCDEGMIVMAGFGEYGIRGSIALNHAVFRLVDAASDRVAEVYGNADTDGEADADEDTPADEAESPSPEPSPSDTAGDEGDAEDEDES
jgi:hypothetical protein